MSRHVAGLTLHEGRWHSEEELERLRRTTDLRDDPDAEEQYFRTQTRRGSSPADALLLISRGDPKKLEEQLRRQIGSGTITKREAGKLFAEVVDRFEAGPCGMANFAIAIDDGGSWRLPKNNVWNVPDTGGELRLAIRTVGPWQTITGLRGIAATLEGCVYGPRALSRPTPDNYIVRGYVSLGGKHFRAFTGSRLFERPNGSLINVGMLWVTGVKPSNPFRRL